MLLWISGIVRLGLERRDGIMKYFILVGLSLIIAGCSSPQFKQERRICTATWMKKIPPRNEVENYLMVQSRQVPTGQTNCTTNGYGNYAYTNCNQMMRTEYYNVPSVRTVDRNQSRRDKKITSCTRQKCNKKYGNAKCET
jgi:hypothetical protein